MKIKLTAKCVLLPYGKDATFHKGRTYSAIVAFNQPNWLAKQKVFAQKKNGAEILLQKGEYTIVNETFDYCVKSQLGQW